MSDEKETKKIEVETYANDMAKIIGENQDGIIKKIIHEEEAHNVEVEKHSLEHKKNKAMMFIGIAMVVIAFIAVSLVYLLKEEILTIEVKPQYVPIIFIDKMEMKDITGLKKEDIQKNIFDEVQMTDVKKGGIEGLYLTENKKVLGFRRFLELNKISIDQSKINFIDDNFLIGISNKGVEETLSVDKNLFFLIKMRSFTDIFEAMRGWEGKMFLDMHSFFGIELNSDTKYLLEKDFEDGIVQNKNARILYDSEGNIVLMYVFAEDDSLIITDDREVVKEVKNRLGSSKVRK